MPATFGRLPPAAAWRHHDARDGYEVVFLETGDAGLVLDYPCIAVRVV
jgi:hypothetical protein